MNIMSGQSWIQKEDRDSYGNRDYIKIKYLQEDENLYHWGYYKSQFELEEDIGSNIYGSMAVLRDQLKNFIPLHPEAVEK